MAVQVKVQGKKLIIEADIASNPQASKGGTGPNLILATTSGNMKTGIKYNGKEITVGLNAYIPKE